MRVPESVLHRCATSVHAQALAGVEDNGVSAQVGATQEVMPVVWGYGEKMPYNTQYTGAWTGGALQDVVPGTCVCRSMWHACMYCVLWGYGEKPPYNTHYAGASTGHTSGYPGHRLGTFTACSMFCACAWARQI